MFNTAQTFGPFTTAQEYVLTVKANGGSVALSVEHGPGVFMPASTVTTDSAQRLYIGRAKVRLTPVGGAEFSLS